MESDTLNPTHTERHTQKGYTLGFFILSLSLETEKKSRNNSKNERGLTLYFPTTTSATGASRILLYSKRFLTLRESEYTTERERERERFFEKIRERCRIVPKHPFVVIVKATPLRTPHTHRSLEIEAEEEDEKKQRSW